MEDLEECIKYFREREYKRIFSKMRAKYESYGKWEGNVILEHPTIGEKEALSGFMKRDYHKNKSITISLRNFEKRLQETRFSNISLKTIVENYDAKPLMSKKSKVEQEKKEEETFYQQILEKNKNKKVYPILQILLQEKSSHGFKMHYTKNREQLKQALQNACDCFHQLPKQKTKLPIFSAKTMKDPHGLDKSNLTGQILVKLLAVQNKQKEPRGAEELAELYYQNNLLVDDVSNMVLCKNIKAYTENGEHLAWKGFWEENEAMQATLENLAKIIQVRTEYDYVIVMENPAVFTAIADRLQERRVPIVCTYGQVKLAGILLLRLLEKNCKTIYYSGDIDPEGIQIADKLKTKFPDTIQLLGFHKEAYYRNLSDIILTRERLYKLEKLKNEELIELAKEVKTVGKASYEELNIEEIMSQI
ncbi:MAG: TIGR02679 family protein [Clostridia bacterium]|nr:TIGR02679 family protein [Clostridia bacterium]